MFCRKGSKRSVLKKRQNTFMTEYLPKVWEEAKVLKVSKDELMDMIQKITKEGKDMFALETKDLTKKYKKKLKLKRSNNFIGKIIKYMVSLGRNGAEGKTTLLNLLLDKLFSVVEEYLYLAKMYLKIVKRCKKFALLK